MIAGNQIGRDDWQMQHDLIGLSFYEVSDQYKRKFLTLHSHFTTIEHHPLKRLMEEFRKWLPSYITEKQNKIKTASQMMWGATKEASVYTQ